MRRRWFIVVAAVLAVNIGIFVADRVSDNGRVTGPTGSSYVTTGEGTAAWYDALGVAGHPVDRLRTPPNELDVDTTLILLEPSQNQLSSDDLRAAREFVSAGGRLVAGGALPSWLEEVVGDSLAWAPAPVGTAVPVGDSPETAFVEDVSVNSLGVWTEVPDEATTLLESDRGDPFAVAMNLGAGRMILIADVTPFLNSSIGAADNAAFALGVIGEKGRPVVFDEFVHGFGDSQGLAGLPESWLWVLGLGLVALAAYLLSIGRRLGPAEIVERELQPARREYLDAMAGTLERTGNHVAATAPVRETVRAEIRRRAKLEAEGAAQSFRSAALRLGLSEEEIRALTSSDPDEQSIIATGNALAKLSLR